MYRLISQNQMVKIFDFSPAFIRIFLWRSYSKQWVAGYSLLLRRVSAMHVQSVKSIHQYFHFFRKELPISLGSVSNERSGNSTFYKGIQEILSPVILVKITVFQKFCAISQKIMWNGNYIIKTVVFSKRTMITVIFYSTEYKIPTFFAKITDFLWNGTTYSIKNIISNKNWVF